MTHRHPASWSLAVKLIVMVMVMVGLLVGAIVIFTYLGRRELAPGDLAQYVQYLVAGSWRPMATNHFIP